MTPDQFGFAKEFHFADVAKKNIVYFCFLGDEMIYIGRTTCLLGRIHTHIMNKTDAMFNRGHCFDRVFYVSVEEDDAFDAEGAFVRYFKPIRNSSMPRNRNAGDWLSAPMPQMPPPPNKTNP